MATLGKYEYTNSIHADGSRRRLYPADVRGRFQNLKKLIHPLMILNFLVLPLIKVGGDRLLLLDVHNRMFFIFGMSFNAQDIYLVFFLVTGLAFTLFFITAVVGRIFCGWACPQTVFLEGLYRRVERWIEGPQSRFFKNASAKNKTHYRNRILKYSLYVLISVVIAHFLVLYFVQMGVFVEMYQNGIDSHPIVFAWLVFLTFLLTFNYGWFREQLCVVICPYGRLQSVLTDDDSLVIGYDPNRGEPRGRVKDENRGDCIDCGRCVEVCPTGIDIRNGLQMECIGCANCIDACDEIMDKIGQPRGLVRYDSYNGLTQQPTKILRPRIYAYAVLLAVGAVISSFMFAKRTSFEANMIRNTGAPYLLVDDRIQNQFEIHIVNKDRFERTFVISTPEMQGVTFTIPIEELRLPKFGNQRIPVFVSMPKSEFEAPFELEVQIQKTDHPDTITARSQFLGPR